MRKEKRFYIILTRNSLSSHWSWSQLQYFRLRGKVVSLKLTWLTTEMNLQGVPKVIVQRFGLIARPLVIRSAKFLRECSRKVAHSRNTLSFAKSAFIFSNERSFFPVFAPLQCLDHIPFELLLFGLSRYSTPEKMRALASGP